MATKKSTNVPATKGKTDVAAVDYTGYENDGFQDTSSDDFALPFLDILQGQSPEVESLDGAKPGMFHNTVTDDLFDGEEGVVVIPVGREHVFVEWKPRNQGGGVVGRHSVDAQIVADARGKAEKWNELKTDNGNDLVETFYLYLILVTADGPSPAVLSCSSTRIKGYKALMTKANMILVPTPDGRKIKPPLFAHRFRLRTEKRENSDGKWHTFVVAFDGKTAAEARLTPDDELFTAAAEFAQVVKSGGLNLDTKGEGKSRDNADDDAPF